MVSKNAYYACVWRKDINWGRRRSARNPASDLVEIAFGLRDFRVGRAGLCWIGGAGEEVNVMEGVVISTFSNKKAIAPTYLWLNRCKGIWSRTLYMSGPGFFWYRFMIASALM
jgi:hypothetical protein